MSELDNTKTAESRPVPFWARVVAILYSIGFSILAAVSAMFNFILFLPPPPFFLYILFFTTLVLGIALSLRRYKSVGSLVYSMFVILMLWSVLITILILLLIKPYYLFIAKNILPAYSGTQLIDVEYSAADMTSPATVRYQFYSNQQEADYQKMKVLYKNELTDNGYTMNEETQDSYVNFQTQRSSDPTIFLGTSDQDSNQINVNVYF